MNLRLSVFVFVLLSALSTAASASWFSGYQAKAENKETKATSTAVSAVSDHEYKDNKALSYPVIQNSALSSHQQYNAYLQQLAQNPMSVYFLPQVQAAKATLAPSFDVVAREMAQIKQEQMAHEHTLVSYVQESLINSTIDNQ